MNTPAERLRCVYCNVRIGPADLAMNVCDPCRRARSTIDPSELPTRLPDRCHFCRIKLQTEQDRQTGICLPCRNVRASDLAVRFGDMRDRYQRGDFQEA